MIPTLDILAATAGVDSSNETIGLVPQLLLIGASFSFSIIADKYFKQIGIPSILSILAFSFVLVFFIGQSPLNFSFDQKFKFKEKLPNAIVELKVGPGTGVQAGLIPS